MDYSLPAKHLSDNARDIFSALNDEKLTEAQEIIKSAMDNILMINEWIAVKLEGNVK